jgi:hypothetical protein
MMLQLGKRYMTRNGRLTAPLRRSSEVQRPYTCGIRNYTFDGKWNTTLQTAHDLILEVPQTTKTYINE